MFSRAGLLLRTAKEFRSFSTTARLLKTHYDTLGLKPAATAAEIKNAYYEKTKMYHPDTSSVSEESIRKFREISEAYEVLGSPISRKEYDENVLGIIRDDIDETVIEDPIELYRRRKMARPDAMYIWTKSHYEILRKQQKTPYEVKSQIVKQQHEPHYPPNYITVVILAGFCLMQYYFYNNKSVLFDGK